MLRCIRASLRLSLAEFPPFLVGGGGGSLCSVKAANWSEEAYSHDEDNMHHSKSTDSYVHPIQENTFTKTSRIMFLRISGHCGLAKKTHDVNCHTADPQLQYTHTFARGNTGEASSDCNARALCLLLDGPLKPVVSGSTVFHNGICKWMCVLFWWWSIKFTSPLPCLIRIQNCIVPFYH